MNLRKFGLITLIASIGTAVFGASIDHIQNYTAEYNANMAQQGAISATTSVYYNPAGLMRLKNGTYFTGGVQLAFGDESMEYKTKHNGVSSTSEADLLAPIPNFALFKKTDDRAYFWTFSGIAGGGNLEYDEVPAMRALEDVLTKIQNPYYGNSESPMPGLNLFPLIGVKNLSIDGSSVEGENMYGQTTLGMAWNVNSKLSLSAAGRLVYGWRNLKGKLKAEADASLLDSKGNIIKELGHITGEASIDSERTAWGFGGQFGLNYAYNDTWNFAMRYDTKIKMEFEADANSQELVINAGGLPLKPGLGFENFFPQYKDGAKFRRDLPAILAVGASQKVTDKWTMFYGANYYFNESAKIDKDVVYTNILDENDKTTGIEYDNGWEISVGTEYWLNEKWAVLGGVNYAKTGAKAESYSDVEFALDSILVGMGVKYRPDEDTEWVVSTSHYFYEAENGVLDKRYHGEANAQKYDKNISSIGFSYTKKF